MMYVARGRWELALRRIEDAESLVRICFINLYLLFFNSCFCVINDGWMDGFLMIDFFKQALKLPSGSNLCFLIDMSQFEVIAMKFVTCKLSQKLFQFLQCFDIVIVNG